jgi:hypothetical protein
MAAPSSKSKGKRSAAVGVSGGTGFTGLVLLLPESVLRQVLLILAPAMTVFVSSLWDFIADEISSRLYLWKIRSQRRQFEKLSSAIEGNPSADEDLKQRIRDGLRKLTIAEADLSTKRVQAIVDLS